MIAGLYKIFDNWHQQGSVWITSDTHFADQDILAGVQGRISDEELVRLINSKVGKCDTLIHLGDVGNVEYIKKLRAARKILIMGNHDSGRTNYERKVVTQRFNKDYCTKAEAIKTMKDLYPDCRISVTEGFQFQAPFEYWDVSADNGLFDEVYEGPLMISEKLILSHEPVQVPWAFNIHGHVHSKNAKSDSQHQNVCVDVCGYLPLNLNQWMKQGHFSKVETIHRETICRATARKQRQSQT